MALNVSGKCRERTEAAMMQGVVYVTKTSEDYLTGMLAKMTEEQVELVSVVPKVETSLIGLPQTVGLWLFWKKS
jgi:hypothetical protein